VKWKFWNRKAEEAKKPLDGPGKFGKNEDKPAPEELLRRSLRAEIAQIEMQMFFLDSAETEKSKALREKADSLRGQAMEIERKRGGLTKDEEHRDMGRWIENAKTALEEMRVEREEKCPPKKMEPIESDLRFERIHCRIKRIDLDEEALARFFASGGNGLWANGPLLQLAKLHDLVRNDPKGKKIEERIKKKARKLAEKERGKEAAKAFDDEYEKTNLLFLCSYVPASEVGAALNRDLDVDSGYMKREFWKEAMERGRDEQLTAHGVDCEKGGLVNFVNIMLEGRTRLGRYGSLSHELGMCVAMITEAGSYGPYYIVIVDVCNGMVRPGPNRGYIMPEELHSAYLVPGEAEKEMVKEAFFRAVGIGIVTKGEAVGALARLVTYKEFVDAPSGVFHYVFREGATLSENPSEEERAAWDFFSKNAKEMESWLLSRAAGN
jgi:hypothetical protein